MLTNLILQTKGPDIYNMEKLARYSKDYTPCPFVNNIWVKLQL